MSDPFISYSSRNHLREVLSGYPPKRIEHYFALGDFFPNETHIPTCKGEGRIIVERFYAAIDFSSQEAMTRFFVVLEEILHDLEPAQPKYPWQHPADEAEELFARLLRFLARDGIGFEQGQVCRTDGLVGEVNINGLPTLSADEIKRQISRAKTRIAQEDYPAAITVSYTLVEHFLKAMLHDLKISFKDGEGDVKVLYSLLKLPLNLNPAGENIGSYIQPILEGLQKQISGLYFLANKTSDRHALTFEPERHHALLAINTAFTLCEFLLGVWQNKNRDE